MTEVAWGSVPFDEAVQHFRRKVNVPSAKWADILEGAHTAAFTVAGATKDGMLADFRTAIDKAIAEGTTLEEFRKDFDTITSRYGWDYNGARGWRTRTIYATNLSTAYAAGRWQQMTDPDVAQYRPYWKYQHDDGVAHPRPEHVKWSGTVLLSTDDWWRTHYPPNGWGCGCHVVALSRRDLTKLGKTGPDQAPAIETRQVTLNTSAGPTEISVPKGIDAGWGYNVGEAASGRKLSEATMAAWRQHGAGAWKPLTSGDWQSAGRPQHVPADTPRAKPGEAATSIEALAQQIRHALGGDAKALKLPTGDPVRVDAEALAAHMPLDRAQFVPFLPEMIDDPYEIWLRFEQHAGTGKVVLRKRIIKRLDLDSEKSLVLVAQAAEGRMEAWTLVPSTNPEYVRRQRVGRLIWARDGKLAEDVGDASDAAASSPGTD